MTDKIHLIPGPVKTNQKVKLAAMKDVAPWSLEFGEIYSSVKDRVLKIANGVDDVHSTVLIPGCGHMVMESILRSFVPISQKILIPNTGNYAVRLSRVAKEAGIDVINMPVPPTKKINPIDLDKFLTDNKTVKHVGLVYSETGTGVVHDLDALGKVVASHKARLVVDAVSAFGALPVNLANHSEIDAVGATANKCLEGIPGLGIIMYRKDKLSAGRARSWTFDVHEMNLHVEKMGPSSPRFTPATNAILALNTALDLLDEEGGSPVRLERYNKNMKTLYYGIMHMGLIPALGHDAQGPIIINVHGPAHSSSWDSYKFSTDLDKRGLIISPWAPLDTPSFRIGCIGDVSDADISNALQIIRDVLPSHF